MSVQKAKLQSREQNVCVADVNKIMGPISQIFHIRNKTLNPCLNGVLERRCKVQTRFQGLFNFSRLMSKREEALGTRLHKV